MLPRVATTTGALQPSIALQASASVDATVKPPPSAAALANLRAEVLLRLIETMLKHMPRPAEPNAGRELLETLLAALKSLPDREGGNTQKLADVIAKLPPELRPRVEKLIGAVLSAMPTRSLVDIVRNPNGPEAQKLAALLATSLHLGEEGDPQPAATERQQKPVALTAQQLAVVARHGAQPGTATQTAQALGDARILQAALKRIFDLDGGARPRSVPASATATSSAAAGSADDPVDTDVTVERDEPVRPVRQPAEKLPVVQANTVHRAEPRLPSAAITAANQQAPVEVVETTLPHGGEAEVPQIAEEAEATTPAVRREALPTRMPTAGNATGQALARSVLQAVAREVPATLITQAVIQLVENLSPEEATFLRAVLERPFDPEIEQELALIVREQAEETPEAFSDAEAIPDPMKTRTIGAQPTASALHMAADDDMPLPTVPGREMPQGTIPVDVMPERQQPVALMRDGVPLAFVPYLPAEEDLDWPENREAEQEEESDEERAEDDGAEPDGGGEDEVPGEEPETADMARRREKAEEMVGVIEPGLVFYQKLGDYWT